MAVLFPVMSQPSPPASDEHVDCLPEDRLNTETNYEM